MSRATELEMEFETIWYSTCFDCRINLNRLKEQGYWIHDYLWWGKLGLSAELLCIGCLELRLGRMLNEDDFIYHPYNYKWPEHYSRRLQDRKNRPGPNDSGYFI